MKLVESLIGREVTVGQGSECHLTFVRGLLHIAQQDPRIDQVSERQIKLFQLGEDKGLSSKFIHAYILAGV